MYILDYVSCGDAISSMDIMIPQITSLIITIIEIGVPVLLIVFGMLDLGKAVMAQKEDEIKKAQQTFLKRLLSAALVFFVIMIVQVIFNLVAGNNDGEKEDIWDCVSCFISGPTDDAKDAAKGNSPSKPADCRYKGDAEDN